MMRPHAILTLGITLASAAPADAGVLQRLADKQQARREWKQLLRSNRDLAVRRRGELGLKSLGVKSVSGVAAAAIEGVAVLDWFGKAMNGFGGGDSLAVGTIAALGVGIGGWKLAGAVQRAANTRTVEYALTQGHKLSPAQIEKWQRAGVIGALSTTGR